MYDGIVQLNKSTINNLAKRFKKEKQEFIRIFYLLGVEIAAEDIDHISYGALVEAVYSKKHYSELKCFDKMKSKIEKLVEENPGFDIDYFMAGWRAGLRAMWDQISPKLSLS